MPGLGPGGRRFESFHPDYETVAQIAAVSFFAIFADFGKIPVGMKGFGPWGKAPLTSFYFATQKRSISFRLAALRVRGLVRRLTRSNTFVPALVFGSFRQSVTQ